jgi:hypothetical protein
MAFIRFALAGGIQIFVGRTAEMRCRQKET